METKPYNIQAPESIAKDFGGDKQKIAAAAQSGMLDPTAAVLAGMFIDRMRSAQAMEQAPNTTVAQDTMAAPQSQMMPQGQMPQGQMPQGQMPQPQPEGIDALPVNEEMFEFAGGGIVAFAEGDRVQGPLRGALQNMTQQERFAYLRANPQAAKLYEEELARYKPILREREDPEETARQAEEKARISAEFSRDYHARQDQIDAGVPAIGSASARRGARSDGTQGSTLSDFIPDIWLKGDPHGGQMGRNASDFTAMDPALAQTLPDMTAHNNAQGEQGEQGPPATTDPSNLQGAVTAMPEAPVSEQAPQADTAGLGALAQQSGISQPSPSGYGGSVEDALARADALRAGIAPPQTPDAQAAFDQQKQFNEMAGVQGPELFKSIAEELKEERESNKTSKKDAANMRLLEAGLNIMAGESPHAMANIGKGASKALQGYAKDIKEIKELDREMAKQERDLMVAEDQMRRGDATAASSGYSKMQERQQTYEKDRASLAQSIDQSTRELLAAEDRARIAASGNVTAAQVQADALRRDRLLLDTDKEISKARGEAADYADALDNITNTSPAARKYRELLKTDPQAAAEFKENVRSDREKMLLQNLPSFDARQGGQSLFNMTDGPVDRGIVASYGGQ